jgi:signal transduction histidine kinase
MVSPSWATIPPPFVWLGLTAAVLWRASRRVEAEHVAAHQAAERSATLERHQRFMHDVSHELRTPVTIARGHLELVLRGAGGQRDVEVALDELARVDGADPEHLRIALDALLENAVKYSRAGAAIELRAHCIAAGTVAIEVADEGVGVPAQALERIFERFGRADTARARTSGGVGLGLAIVDAIAKRHGGRCTVASTPGGSIFGLELPEFTPAPDANAEAQLAEPALS